MHLRLLGKLLLYSKVTGTAVDENSVTVVSLGSRDIMDAFIQTVETCFGFHFQRTEFFKIFFFSEFFTAIKG